MRRAACSAVRGATGDEREAPRSGRCRTAPRDGQLGPAADGAHGIGYLVGYGRGQIDQARTALHGAGLLERRQAQR